jgi:hypothetical protein
MKRKRENIAYQLDIVRASEGAFPTAASSKIVTKGRRVSDVDELLQKQKEKKLHHLLIQLRREIKKAKAFTVRKLIRKKKEEKSVDDEVIDGVKVSIQHVSPTLQKTSVDLLLLEATKAMEGVNDSALAAARSSSVDSDCQDSEQNLLHGLRVLQQSKVQQQVKELKTWLLKDLAAEFRKEVGESKEKRQKLDEAREAKKKRREERREEKNVQKRMGLLKEDASGGSSADEVEDDAVVESSDIFVGSLAGGPPPQKRRKERDHVLVRPPPPFFLFILIPKEDQLRLRKNRPGQRARRLYLPPPSLDLTLSQAV